MDKLQVLIVDDDKDTANFFSTVLTLVGFDCDIVYTARQALSRLAVTRPDMILLDLRLGMEVGGEDILYQIRSNPRLDETRVIVITAYPAMAEPITNLADLILLKPVEVEQLKTLASRMVSLDTKKKRQYFRDPVTGLFNQEYFNYLLLHALERSRRRSDFLFSVLVFTFDLELQGQGQPEEADQDQVLSQVADRLRQSYRPTDTIARLDGQRFASLHEDLKHPGDLNILIDRLLENLTPPFHVGERTYRLTAYIGAAMHHASYSTASAILDAARQAMESQYQSGETGYRVVSPYKA